MSKNCDRIEKVYFKVNGQQAFHECPIIFFFHEGALTEDKMKEKEIY